MAKKRPGSRKKCPRSRKKRPDSRIKNVPDRKYTPWVAKNVPEQFFFGGAQDLGQVKWCIFKEGSETQVHHYSPKTTHFQTGKCGSSSHIFDIDLLLFRMSSFFGGVQDL